MIALGRDKKHYIAGALCAAPILLSCTFAHAEDPTVAAAAATSATAPAVTPVVPEAAAPVSPWTFNLTLASQYVTRGFSNSWGEPVVQGGVDYVHPSGFNVGYWMSTLSDK